MHEGEDHLDTALVVQVHLETVGSGLGIRWVLEMLVKEAALVGLADAPPLANHGLIGESDPSVGFLGSMAQSLLDEIGLDRASIETRYHFLDVVGNLWVGLGDLLDGRKKFLLEKLEGSLGSILKKLEKNLDPPLKHNKTVSVCC